MEWKRSTLSRTTFWENGTTKSCQGKQRNCKCYFGEAPNIDNNVSERALREYVIGRKNWLFFGSPEAGKKSAVVMSVLSSARRHKLNEYDYLVDVLYRLSDWNPRVDSLESLLPDCWVRSSTPPTEAAALAAAR